MAVYFVRAGEGPIKIGRAVDPLKRLAALQTAHHEELVLLAVVPVEDAEERHLEALLHRSCRGDWIRGEWFRPSLRLLRMVEEARGATPVPGTFEALVAQDRRLERLVEEAGEWAARAARMPTVCRIETLERRFRPRIERLAGWGRQGEGPLATRSAAEVVLAGISEILPPCRGCLHAMVS